MNHSEIYGFITVALLSMFKCIAGILAGVAMKLPIWTVISANAIGMILTAVVVSLAGPFIKSKIIDKWFPPKKLFSKKNRRTIKVWKSYGLYGVAFLTPILLMPLGGTLIAITFGEKPLKIITYMTIAMIFWATVLTFIVYQIKQAVV